MNTNQTFSIWLVPILLTISLGLTACGGGDSGGGSTDNDTTPAPDATPAQVKAANIPLTVLLRDGERIFNSVVDSYTTVNGFYGSRAYLATLVNEQLAAYTGDSVKPGLVSQPTFVKDLYDEMLALPSVKGVDAEGNRIQLTPEILQQITAGEVVITPVSTPEDAATLKFTDFQHPPRFVDFYHELVGRGEELGVVQPIEDLLRVDLSDTENSPFLGVISSVVGFRDVLLGNDGSLETYLAEMEVRLDEISRALEVISVKLDKLSIDMKQEFTDIVLDDLDNKLIELTESVNNFRFATSDEERHRHATVLDSEYEKLLSLLLDAILDYDGRVKANMAWSNANIRFDMRLNANYDYLKVTLPDECYVNTTTPVQDGVVSRDITTNGNVFNPVTNPPSQWTYGPCDWLGWYVKDLGAGTMEEPGTQWLSHSFDRTSLILDANGRGLGNEIIAPVINDNYPLNFILHDPRQYHLGYSVALKRDFLEVFTSYIYARYLINPWVNGIASAEAKNQASGQRHLELIEKPVGGVHTLSLKDQLLATYSKMKQDHGYLYDGSLSTQVVDGHRRATQDINFLAGLFDMASSESPMIVYQAINPPGVRKIAGSISNYMDSLTGVPGVITDVVGDAFSIPLDINAGAAQFSPIDGYTTVPVKINATDTAESLCCVLDLKAPVYDEIDVYPSVRMRVGTDVWGAIDIGAVGNGATTKLMELYLGARTDKLLISVARLATLEVILKTHCLGINPDAERYATCGID